MHVIRQRNTIWYPDGQCASSIEMETLLAITGSPGHPQEMLYYTVVYLIKLSIFECTSILCTRIEYICIPTTPAPPHQVKNQSRL